VTVAILLRRAQSRPGENDEDAILGPCERGALVAGLRLASGFHREAVAIAVGPARREDRVLAMALRAGCWRAVRLGTEGVNEFDDLDYLGLAELLAAAVRSVGSQLVVCGDRSLDERVGAVGAAVAHLLGFAHATGVGSAEAEAATVLCNRQGDRVVQRLKVSLPAVLCMRPPRIDAERDAARAVTSTRARNPTQAIEVLDPGEIGVDMRRLALRRKLAGRLRPTRAGRHATILDTPAALVSRLRADRLIGPDPACDDDKGAT
jgi:electron transfer flavoprotein beta subunit